MPNTNNWKKQTIEVEMVGTERNAKHISEIKNLTPHLAHVTYSLTRKLVRKLDLQKA